jgi:hypothetical protein
LLAGSGLLDRYSKVIVEGRIQTRSWEAAAFSYGAMFWFTWNTLSGSYFRFASTSLS